MHQWYLQTISEIAGWTHENMHIKINFIDQNIVVIYIRYSRVNKHQLVGVTCYGIGSVGVGVVVGAF